MNLSTTSLEEDVEFSVCIAFQIYVVYITLIHAIQWSEESV